MPAVFVHGVADTYRLWDDVRSRLQDVETIALALPGFDATEPQDFRADKESYVNWITSELERIPKPIDLVGHDWGCILALRVASLRPDLIRTVAAGGGPISKGYQWHQLAKIWQTPGDGEKFMRELDVHALSEILTGLGVSSEAANDAAARVDERMKDCILRLYRSAVHVGEEWQTGLSEVTAPAMIFWGRYDKECPVRFAHELAAQMSNAYVEELDCQHWVPLQKSVELATLLQRHWSRYSHSSAAARRPLSHGSKPKAS